MSLRIFFAVPRAAWVDVNLRQSLEAMGHELISFTFPGWPDDDDAEWRERGKPATNQRLLERFRQALAAGPIDLFYGYFYSSVVYPDTLDEIRRSGVPTVNFSCNNVHQFDLVEQIAPHFDLCVVPEAAAVERFRAVGARPVRIQLAANPAVYHPYPLPREYDVTFVGQRYADRAYFLAHLHRNGVAVRAFGAGWQTRKRLDVAMVRAGLSLLEDEQLDGVRRVVRTQLRRWKPAKRERGAAGTSTPVQPALGMTAADAPGATVGVDDASVESAVAELGRPRLLHRDLIRMFSRSHLSLGFATAGDSHIGPERLTHLRLREFEAPMSGALYLTERQAELAEYFRIGEEVLCYGDRGELLEVARYYLVHPEQAEKVRQAGYHRALREHTWQHRFRELFDLLGLRG